jgi:hypothetical protein
VAEFPFLKRTIQDYADGAARHGLTTTSLGRTSGSETKPPRQTTLGPCRVASNA